MYIHTLIYNWWQFCSIRPHWFDKIVSQLSTVWAARLRQQHASRLHTAVNTDRILFVHGWQQNFSIKMSNAHCFKISKERTSIVATYLKNKLCKIYPACIATKRKFPPYQYFDIPMIFYRKSGPTNATFCISVAFTKHFALNMFTLFFPKQSVSSPLLLIHFSLIPLCTIGLSKEFNIC